MNNFMKSNYTSATPKDGNYNTTGQPILQNHIIVNINENKNINNYYRVVGRKIEEEQNIIRIGARADDDTNSQDLLAKFSADLLDNTNKQSGSKTLISKKLLNKAKQANTKKHIRNMTKQDLNKTSVPISSNLLGHQSYQTARNERKKQKSQFEFNLAQRSRGEATHITLDYDKPRNSVNLNQSTSGVRSAILGQKLHNDISARRKSANSNFNNTQGKNTQRHKSVMKTSRPLAHAKQNHNFTRHKKNKSEAKSRYKNGQMVKTQVEGKQVIFEDTDSRRLIPNNENNLKQTHSLNHSVGSQRHNSFSAQSVSRSKKQAKTKMRHNENGVSLSSGFSSASGKGYQNNSGSFRHQGSESIVQQLNKTYFLNTKQLLRHLSPSKDQKSDINETRLDPQHFRGRSKSQSTTSRTRGQPKSKDKPITMPTRPDTADQQRVLKSKSATLGTAAPAPPPAQTSQGISIHMSAMSKHLKNLDKLIKQNIRKNQTKMEEQQLKQQLEDYRAQQRKNNLSQRNKELRQINASKVVTVQKEVPANKMNISIEHKLPSALAVKERNDRKRSQSCVDYKSFKNKTTIDSDARPPRSQGKSDERTSVQDYSKLMNSHDFKVIPNTTTNQNQASVRQRSFVDEITKLTQQVEKELGLNRNNHPTRTHANHMTMHTKMMMKQVQNDTEVSGPVDRSQLTSFLLDKSNKPSKKKGAKMSLKVQKFIEKKKREEMVKKSLEQTIEAEKQSKIKQNLINLDKYVQKHIRQKSNPTVFNKKFSLQPSSVIQGTGDKKTKHKKNKKTQDEHIVGLSEIFYRGLANHSNSDIMDDDHTPDDIAVQISPSKFASLHASIRDNQDQNVSVVSTAGRSQRQKKPPTSSKSKKRATKSQNKETSVQDRTASGSGVSGFLRKKEVKAQPQSLNPNKQKSVPLPPNTDSTINNSNTQPKLASRLQPGEKSKWLEQKHPNQMQKNMHTAFSSEIPTQSDFNQTTPLTLVQLESKKEKKTHKSSGKIRRIHELVALYRCKFKPNVSDASIIGTLHSAASVIQIHFRYRKHLREANSIIKNQSSKTTHKSTAKQVSKKNENISMMGLEKLLNDDGNNFMEVRGSVFDDIIEEDEVEQNQKVQSVQNDTEIKKETSPKELQFKHVRKSNEAVMAKREKKEKSFERESRDYRRPNKLQLMLDVDQIINEREQGDTLPSQGVQESQNVGGNKTPQIPGLNLGKLNSQPETFNFQIAAHDDNPYGDAEPANDSESQKTVTSYRGLFNRIGLPLPRSARVKVDYDLVQKDPKIKEQLRQIVHFKEVQGKQVLQEGRKQNIISDKTLKVNIKRLEKWVNTSYKKIQEMDNKKQHKTKVRTNNQLIQDNVDGRDRLHKLITGNIDGDSSRQHSHMSQSWRAPGPKQTESNSYYQSYRQSHKEDAYTDRDPYTQHQTSKQHIPLGSGRREQSKLIELIQGETSRTSHKVHNIHSSSESKKDFQKHQEENDDVSLKLDDIHLENVEVLNKGIQNTDKSFNRSNSHPTIQNINDDEYEPKNQRVIDPNEIEFQLEDALEHQKKKFDLPHSDQKTEKSAQLEDLRDPRFFTSKVDDDSVGEENQHLVIRSGQVVVSEPGSDGNSISQPVPSPAELEIFSKPQSTPAIRVENQDNKEKVQSSTGLQPNRNITTQHMPIIEVQANLHSPVSEGQSFDFNKIQTGAHSLSSTDSDMTKALRNANKDILESPPNLTSPKNLDSDMAKAITLPPEFVNLGNEMTDFIMLHLLREIKEEMPILVQRPYLVQHQKVPPHIKFFDKKGVKTDLFAIEKYVDEVLEETKHNRGEFMQEINRPVAKDNLEVLFNMQNSEIGTYEHFQHQTQSVLSLDLYLKLEKRRKESRENPAIVAATGNPDGGFDFDKVTDHELRSDGVNKNFLAECQHIHNKVLFDCINESLQQFRPFGKDGQPSVWSTLGRKLKPTEDFTLEEMFEITKHDIFRMALMQAGTLPRRDFIINNNFEEELFAEIREKKLAGLLCREIVETEPSWLKWDFEEAQTKIDIADMVLESLVTETIEFLNSKNPKSQAQMNFEEIQQMLKSR